MNMNLVSVAELFAMYSFTEFEMSMGNFDKTKI